ncbi:MAG: hypothetical protein LUG45_06905 [Clostridiales bacterium]|nr:hypothetical protein [Clostridiales bacterium]
MKLKGLLGPELYQQVQAKTEVLIRMEYKITDTVRTLMPILTELAV